MGTFGNGLFQEDLALDIKYRFEDMIDEGLEIEKIIDNIFSEFEDPFGDFDDAPTAVLALATLLVENGFTTKRIKSELERIENDKEYWDYLKKENQELYETRLQTLIKITLSLL